MTPHDWRGQHGAWRVLEKTDERRNGYVVWKAICGLCRRLLTVRSDVLAKGSSCCKDCSQQTRARPRVATKRRCGICKGMATRVHSPDPRDAAYCSKACYQESVRRNARRWYRANKTWLNEQRRRVKCSRKTSRGVRHAAAIAAGKRRARHLASAYDALVDLLIADTREQRHRRAPQSPPRLQATATQSIALAASLEAAASEAPP